MALPIRWRGAEAVFVPVEREVKSWQVPASKASKTSKTSKTGGKQAGRRGAVSAAPTWSCCDGAA